jgi:hypothetical protein
MPYYLKPKTNRMISFQNRSIVPAFASKECIKLLLIKLFAKPYKGDTNMNSKPPFQRQLDIPTRAMKGVTMNRAITLTIHQCTSSTTECHSQAAH